MADLTAATAVPSCPHILTASYPVCPHRVTALSPIVHNALWKTLSGFSTGIVKGSDSSQQFRAAGIVEQKPWLTLTIQRREVRIH